MSLMSVSLIEYQSSGALMFSWASRFVGASSSGCCAAFCAFLLLVPVSLVISLLSPILLTVDLTRFLFLVFTEAVAR